MKSRAGRFTKSAMAGWSGGDILPLIFITMQKMTMLNN
jgi:hypothetical protein